MAFVWQNMLKGYLLPSVPTLQFPGGEFIFQQNGATCHTAKKTMQWMTENDIRAIAWPPNTLDL